LNEFVLNNKDFQASTTINFHSKNISGLSNLKKHTPQGQADEASDRDKNFNSEASRLLSESGIKPFAGTNKNDIEIPMPFDNYITT